MRILHCYSSLDVVLGGPPRVVQGLCLALAQLGHQVTIVTTGTTGWGPSDLSASFANGGSLSLEDVPRRQVLRTALPLARQADVVHMHNVWDPLEAWIARECRRAGTPYVFAPHSCFVRWSMDKKRAKKMVYMALVGRRLMRQAGALHLLTADELHGVRELGLTGRYFILPNGVNPRDWAALPRPGAYRDMYPALADGLLIVSLARLSRGKGPDLLLRAFADLAPGFPEARLVLAGPDYGMAQELQDFVGQQGLGDRVLLPGPVSGEARLALLQDADIFALPSHQEGHPMGVVEAAYLGKPLLITPACHCSDLTPGVAAEVVTDDLPGVTEGLHRLLADESYRRALSAEARRIAGEKYTWESIARELAGHYRTILQSPGGLPAL